MAILTAETKQGVVQGVGCEGYSVFKGIPYAKPPIGGLRWRSPQSPDSWEGIRKADRFGSICFQPGQEPGSFYEKEFYSVEEYLSPMSEDCLYLNIWTPAEKAGGRLPVALWIHGGAFLNGYGHELEFDGEACCKKDVILVTINYRLGAFGFLTHKWLREESSSGSGGNYGVLDQIAALNWVYDNIEAFGGDPDNITLMGQSAGSMSVQTLVSSGLTRGKIAKAILQSGGGYKTGINRDRTSAEAEVMGEEFQKLCGVTTMEEWRALPADKILQHSYSFFAQQMEKGVGELPFMPIIDNYVLTDGYEDLLEKGFHADIPYMIGSTQNDLGVTPQMLANGEKSQLYKGCIGLSLLNRKMGREADYVYYFTRELLGDSAGAFHSSELWYMFGTLERSWRPKETVDYKLSEQMVSYWTNFMKRGDPNGEGLPEWKRCDKEEQFVKEFGI